MENMSLQDIIYAGLNRNTNAFIFARDLESTSVLFASPNYESIYERPLTDYIANPDEFIEFVHQEDKSQVLKSHNAFINNRENKDEEYRIHTPNGKIKWLWSRVFHLSSSGLGDSVVVGIVEDISRMREVESDLCDLSELAHDLRSPLNSIRGLNKILEVELAGNDHFRSYFEHIEKSCNYGLKVIEEALTYAQVKTKDALKCESFQFLKFLYEVIELHKLDADQLGVNLSLNCNTDNKLEITGDKVLLQRALSNLISNALKFTKSGGFVKVDASVQDESVHITVQDNGIGIPESITKYMFDKFSKAKRTGVNGERPDGVGLYNVKNIVTLHGGDVTFESSENKGTTFQVAIPFVPGLCITPWS